MKLLEGKVAIITGASRGIGKGIAEVFAKHGANVAFTYSSSVESALALENELNALGIKAKGYQSNAADFNEAQKLVDDVIAEFGTIDVLINNAGLAVGADPIQNVTFEAFENMLQTNVHGLFYCTKLILPLMLKKNKGHIVNLGSVAGEFPYSGGNIYGGTKAFVHQMSLNLRSDLLGTNIRVTCIEPGMCESEFSEVRFNGDKKKAEAVYHGGNSFMTSKKTRKNEEEIVAKLKGKKIFFQRKTFLIPRLFKIAI